MNNSHLHRAVLASKLSPPTISTQQVARLRIHEQVLASQAIKVILVQAPAGFGKTTAMIQCRAALQAQGIDCAWLTLDTRDNDPARFLTCLDAALASISEESPTPFESSVGRFSLGDQAVAIMERLASFESPFALFLDDFECIQEPAMLSLMRELIDHLPRRGQVIIGSRALPNIGLGRLQARRQLLEIDAKQLRFSLDETSELFTTQQQPLSPGELEQLYRTTEGWAAALWLAALALQREGRAELIERFSNSHDALADYLTDEVLSQQPEPNRQFLLQTSILKQLDADICNALLGRDDSSQLLESLAAANLFLIPIEGKTRSYRYHSLFAGFLRVQLQRHQGDQVSALHARASTWYADHGRPVPAIDHALEAKDYPRVIQLLCGHAEVLLAQGRMLLLKRWLESIPAQYLRNSPWLLVVQAWALCFTCGPRDALAVLEESGCESVQDDMVQAHILALRPYMLAMMDQYHEAYRVGSEALKQMPTTHPFAETALANVMAFVGCILGQHQESQRLLDEPRRWQGKNHDESPFNRMYRESIEGLIDIEHARLRQATARFRMAVNATHTESYSQAHGNAFAGVYYAACLYEAGEQNQASRLLHVYVPLARNVGLADHIILGYLCLIRIAFNRGDIDEVFQHLVELEYIGHQRQVPRVVSSAKLERARILLMQGNRQAAAEELERASDPSIWTDVNGLHMPAHYLENYELSSLRLALHAPDSDAAACLKRVDAAVAEAKHAGHLLRGLKLRLFKSMAEAKAGAPANALNTLDEVLRATCQEGFVRMVLDEGEQLGRLVRNLCESFERSGKGSRDPIYIEYLHRLLQGFGPSIQSEEDGTLSTANDLIEPLTPKEIRILLLLAEGYSNGALTEKLFVSDSTVRTHLRNINAKLNAQNRTQAVAIARRLGIIR